MVPMSKFSDAVTMLIRNKIRRNMNGRLVLMVWSFGSPGSSR